MTTQRDIEAAQRRSRRIDHIYQYLDDVVEYVSDPELQEEILDWMEEADEVPASTLLDHVEGVLAEFVQYPMYRKHGDGSDDFPDNCQGCEHYREACPLFTQRRKRKKRERLQDELVGATEDEVKQKLRQLAGRVDCHVITDEIETWETEFSKLLSRGQDLRRQTIHLLRPKDDVEAATGQLAEAGDGGKG